MKRYFKRRGEEGFEDSVFYLEFEGDWPTRQVERHGDLWFNSSVPYHDGLGPSLSDQPLSEHEMKPEHEITSSEFEEVWERSMREGDIGGDQ